MIASWIEQTRLDLTLGYQNLAYDMDRLQLIYATRYVFSNICQLLYCISKTLRSLQNASGIYGMVAPSASVEFPGQSLGNFVGGETLRVVLPKPDGKVRKQTRTLREESSCEN